MPQLSPTPCRDSESDAASRRRELALPRGLARDLGRSAVAAIRDGFYTSDSGRRVDWHAAVAHAIDSKISIPPDAALPAAPAGPAASPGGAASKPGAGGASGTRAPRFDHTTVEVVNETTLGAARRLVEAGRRPLALNFANGIHPGGGFLNGATAQEEVLCRSSALHATLEGDPMYASHAQRHEPDSTDWAILSPDVPVFRTDDGTTLEEPWQLSFITCAAPVASAIGRRRAAALLRERIHRVLAIARAYGYATLVLGAWGCGAFGNDPLTTARDFRSAIEGEFAGSFDLIIFAIADWSPERRFLGPFCGVFGR